MPSFTITAGKRRSSLGVGFNGENVRRSRVIKRSAHERLGVVGF